ncbi:unnamed protein product, partial [Mesorhabditis spiculigera]
MICFEKASNFIKHSGEEDDTEFGVAMSPKKQPTVVLSNGVEMPMIGFGTWQLSGEAGKDAIKTAIRSGYRHIDTAAIYENEAMIGEALKAYNHLAAIENALQLLGTHYIDLYLLHMPPMMHDGLTIEDVWRGFERLYDLGLTRAIGVSNCSYAQMEKIRKIARIPIQNSQNECHVFFPAHDLQAYCQRHNIVLTSFATLGSTHRDQFPAFKWVEGHPSPLNNQYVRAIAEKHGKSPAQVLLRYMLDRGICVIPKAASHHRIAENIDILDFHLTADEIKKLGSLKEHIRYFTFSEFKDHPDYPFANCSSAKRSIGVIYGH